MVFKPPFGSLNIPHPRTPADLIIRSFAIQLFAAVAYGHLLYLLGFRKPHGFGTLSILLVPLFLVLPELVLLQFCIVIFPVLIARSYRKRFIDRFKALPIELGILRTAGAGQGAALGNLGLHAAFAVFNAIPLGAVVGAYKQRQRMTYHGFGDVSVLALDHRNVWASVGGILAVAIALTVICGLAFVVAGGIATGDTGLPTQDIGRYDDDRAKPLKPELQHEQMSYAERMVSIDWDSVAEVVYVAFVHQILLSNNRYPVPLYLIFRGWYLWPLAAIVVWYMYRRRRVDAVSLAYGLAIFFVFLTLVIQLWWELVELWEVTHGIMSRHNFRWQVKDQVSMKHTRDF